MKVSQEREFIRHIGVKTYSQALKYCGGVRNYEVAVEKHAKEQLKLAKENVVLKELEVPNDMLFKGYVKTPLNSRFCVNKVGKVYDLKFEKFVEPIKEIINIELRDRSKKNTMHFYNLEGKKYEKTILIKSVY